MRDRIMGYKNVKELKSYKVSFDAVVIKLKIRDSKKISKWLTLTMHFPNNPWDKVEVMVHLKNNTELNESGNETISVFVGHG